MGRDVPFSNSAYMSAQGVHEIDFPRFLFHSNKFLPPLPSGTSIKVQFVNVIPLIPLLLVFLLCGV